MQPIVEFRHRWKMEWADTMLEVYLAVPSAVVHRPETIDIVLKNCNVVGP